MGLSGAELPAALFFGSLVVGSGLVLLYGLTESLLDCIQAAEPESTARVIATDTATRVADPKDTADYLRQHGWEQVNTSPERYVGHYQAGGVTMEGGLERTPGGRRRFFVHDPPPGFVRHAEDGECLPKKPDLTENTSEIHFDPKPDAFGDGVDVVETMLEEADNA